jgi:hypothetical protein
MQYFEDKGIACLNGLLKPSFGDVFWGDTVLVFSSSQTLGTVQHAFPGARLL